MLGCGRKFKWLNVDRWQIKSISGKQLGVTKGRMSFFQRGKRQWMLIYLDKWQWSKSLMQMWWGGGGQLFSSKAVDKVSSSMSSRLHTQILYMLLLLIMMTAVSCGSINRQTLYILWKKKTLIDFEYSL